MGGPCESAPLTLIDSPLTMVVIWFLLAPCLFLTSQMNVVLTASSTFITVSLSPSTVTASGKAPDALEVEIWGDIKSGRQRRKTGGDGL